MNLVYHAEVDLPIYMSAEQIAAFFGISKTSVYELMHSEGFPKLRVGKRIIVASKDLLDWSQKTPENRKNNT